MVVSIAVGSVGPDAVFVGSCAAVSAGVDSVGLGIDSADATNDPPAVAAAPCGSGVANAFASVEASQTLPQLHIRLKCDFYLHFSCQNFAFHIGVTRRKKPFHKVQHFERNEIAFPSLAEDCVFSLR